MNKKIISIIILIFLVIAPVMAEDVSATTVFLTCDNMQGNNQDMNMLYAIKNYIEQDSNGQINVIIDSQASNPGEGDRAIQANADVSVTIAYADAANLVNLARSASSISSKHIIYVNAGTLDLDNINFLRRSYDDNYSNSSFANLLHPGKFLSEAGITLIQPCQALPNDVSNNGISESNDNVNKYIADKIISATNSGSSSGTFDSGLISLHKMDPKYMAEDSQKVVNGYPAKMESSYGSYSTQQILYMTSSYIAGYPLSVPSSYNPPSNPEQYSSFNHNSYSLQDYVNMADIVVDYMDKNGQAPNYIDYQGARIGYYDLVYNFALLTEGQTSSSNMVLPQEADFHKYYDNTMVSLVTIGIIIIIIIVGVILVRNAVLKHRYKKRHSRRRRPKNRRLR
jgi:hypothetical protein